MYILFRMNFKILSIFIACAAIFGRANSVAVICYYASWAAYDGATPESFNASLCTHINYAFITVWEDGNLKVEDDELDINEGLYLRVTDMKKVNSDLKVLLSVGGADSGDLFREIAPNATKRAAFVGSAEYFLSTYNFDGLDIDWEYPESGDEENYITLLKELKEVFEPYGWLLTTAVSAQPTEHGYSFAEMNKYLDFINLMTYDFYTIWSVYTGQCSPLFASSVETDWEKTHLNVAASATNWVNAGIPKEKLAIGTAFYGRSFTLQDPDNHGIHAPIAGVGSDGGSAPYSQLCSQYSNWTRVWDDEQNNPYKYTGDQWYGYDDKDSLWAKADWIKSNGFFGVMIWSIDQDDLTGECDGESQSLLKHLHTAL